MANSVPHEVIAVPATAYVAPVGTAFPTLDDDPEEEDFVMIGSNGPLNYDSADGVVLEAPYNVVKWLSAGDTAPRKAFPTEEGLIIRLKLVDMTLEQLAHALNYNTVTDTAAGAGTVGHRKIGLSRGVSIVSKALLIRFDASPYIEPGKSQFEIPVAMQTGAPTINLSKKGEPAGYSLAFEALVDPNAASVAERLGRFRAQDAIAI